MGKFIRNFAVLLGAVTMWNSMSWAMARCLPEQTGFYGFIRGTVAVADSSVSSFGVYDASATPEWSRVNQVAPTEAAFRKGAHYSEQARTSWTLGQSRFGYCAAISESVTGAVELDFVDFDRAQATTAIRPRLRVAGIEKTFASGDTLFVGQNWDILAMAKPFTYNYVGLYFRSGNIGFQRPQIRYTHYDGGAERYALMLGSSGVNDKSSSDSQMERGVAPALGGRIFVVSQDEIKWGWGARYQLLRTETTPPTAADHQQRTSWVVSSNVEWKPLIPWELRFNVYGGTNVNSDGASLTLSSARFSGDQKEWGAFLTSRWRMNDRWALQGGLGQATLLSGSDRRVGDLVENRHAELALAWTEGKKIEWFIEAAHFESSYRETVQAVATFRAMQIELGVVAHF